MKTKRFSLGVKIASILSAVAILSVGFASWLIVSAPENKTYSEGAFTVETVAMKTAEFSEITVVDGTVVFGKGDDPAETNYGWLKATNVGADDLSAQLTFTISTKDENNTSQLQLNEVLQKVTITLDTPTEFDSLVGNTLAAPTITYTYSTNVTETTEAADFTEGKVALDIDLSNVDAISIEVTVDITFAWGTDGNPFTYYNSLQYTEQLGEEAFNVLNGVYGLKDAKYSVTIAGTLKEGLQ